MSDALHLAYRPQSLDDLVGQDSLVRSLEAVIKKGMPHVFLFTGPSGTGKTTVARILAKEIGCVDTTKGLMEVDAATHTGIDAMRSLTENLMYRSIGLNRNKFIIIDECHSISKQGWQSLLKDIEEPPEHVYWAFCTTEAGKVPKTIKTRCHSYDLKLVQRNDLISLLKGVCKKEKIKLDKESLRIIAKESFGSPRQALVYLSMCSDCGDADDVAQVLSSPEGSSEVIELCRMLVGGKSSFPACVDVLKKLDNQNAEGIRLVILNYTSAVLINSKRNVSHLLNILDAFSEPCNQSEKLAPILLALGQIFLSE